MDLIFLFRKLVFAQVLLGVVAFCMADQNPEMLLIAGGLVAMSWYVVEGPSGKPLPQWIVLIGALAAALGLFGEMWLQPVVNPVRTLGHFTIWLQVLQLYAHKTNRDYALLLMLSLLQMVGATVLSVSVIFGAMLIVYCVLALFTVLLFQLKGTSDLVWEMTRKAAGPEREVERSQAVAGRGHRWQFRLVAIMVGLISGVTAVVLFVLLPRAGSDPQQPSPWGAAEAQQRTGFTQTIQLGRPAPRGGSREPVLNLTVLRDGQNLGSPSQPFHLRGASLDYYDPSARTWVRSQTAMRQNVALQVPESSWLLATPADPNTPMLEAHLTMRMPGEQTLFTLFPTVSIEDANFRQVLFNPLDLQVTVGQAVVGAMIYSLKAPAQGDGPLFEQIRQLQGEPGLVPEPSPVMAAIVPTVPADQYARGWNVDAPAVRRVAQQMLQQANVPQPGEGDDGQASLRMAQALANQLRTTFTYTLNNPPVAGQADPVVEFLTRHRQGHCELFAAGLVAMARTLGLRGRVITGYLAHDFNAIGGYYVVRQTNAHAWAEIECGDLGWRVFDATPPATVAREHTRTRNWLTWARDLYEHIEFTWLNTIVTYDRATRGAVLESLSQPVRAAATNPDRPLGRLLARIKELWNNRDLSVVAYGMAAGIVLFIGVGILTLIRIWLIRRRRLVALQLTRLPRRQRRMLARRLGFYLTMLDMLERHGFERPRWQSPFAFAQELTERDALRFEPVLALTEHFYEVRFGHRDINADRRKLIRAHLSRLETTLGSREVGRRLEEA